MPHPFPDQPINWRRQVLGHLDSLSAAGVTWLPNAPPLSLPPTLTEAPAAAAPPPPVTPAAAAGAEPAPASPLEQRRQALQMLAAEVKGCMKCPELASTRTQTVFADGPPGVELCFIGEAPGADEDAQGLPFVGAAGQLLNKIIAACGMKREEVYICNILKCRPPGNRTPLPIEASNCRGFLERQLELVQPKFICALGGSAAANLLQTTTPIGKLRGRFHDWRGIPVMVTYHPAYLLPHRSPEKKKDVWEDMKILLARMGRPVPART
ncbi:MAG: uracil-DNA glycosylase [Gemmataceae bacterium]|nr:uracil-DNA glycosylase [Gemmataceae bacterium]